MEKKAFKNNEIIYKQGDIQTSMYRIASGRVAIYIDYKKDNEVLIAELTKGMAFGEMEMMEALPRTTTAVSIDDDTVLNKITFAEFSEIFRDEPDVIMDVLGSLSARTMFMVEEYIKVNKVIKKLKEQQTTEEKEEFDHSFLASVKKYIHDYLKIQSLANPY